MSKTHVNAKQPRKNRRKLNMLTNLQKLLEKITRPILSRWDFIAMDEPNPTKRADTVAADFVKRMETALEASVGLRTVSNKFFRSWFSTDFKKAIQESRKAYEAYRISGLIGDWNHFCSLRKAARTSLTTERGVGQADSPAGGDAQKGCAPSLVTY